MPGEEIKERVRDTGVSHGSYLRFRNGDREKELIEALGGYSEDSGVRREIVRRFRRVSSVAEDPGLKDTISILGDEQTP